MLCIRVDLLLNVYSNNFWVEIPEKRQRKKKTEPIKKGSRLTFLRERESLITHQPKKTDKNKIKVELRGTKKKRSLLKKKEKARISNSNK